MRILFFGDSITQGLYDSQGGWVQRIVNDYHQQSLNNLGADNAQKIACFNLGVAGDRLEQLAKRFKDETEARLQDEEEIGIVFMIGANDGVLIENRPTMDVYTFQETFEKLIDVAGKYTNKILCVGLTAVDESLTDPWPYGSTESAQYRNQRLNLFEDTVKQSAGRKDVPFVPIHDQFLDAIENNQALLSDGLHPSDQGHQFIYDLVKPRLDELIG